MKEIILERVNERDVPTFIRLENSVTDAKTYPWVMTEQKAKDKLKNEIIYFIKKENINVGTIRCILKSSEHMYLNGLVVDPKFQGQGIATTALEILLANELKDFKRVDLVVHPHNAKAIMVYLKLGFIIESWKDNYFEDGEPRITLSRIS
jgi:ribosomal protein S18 acetylase RimI-like enzyme